MLETKIVEMAHRIIEDKFHDCEEKLQNDVLHIESEAARNVSSKGAEKILDKMDRDARYYPQFSYSRLILLCGIYS
jgi:hypothetical protein